MKLSLLILGLAMIAGVAVAGATITGCGPETKFCPATNGPCPPPDAGNPDTGSDRRSDRRN